MERGRQFVEQVDAGGDVVARRRQRRRFHGGLDILDPRPGLQVAPRLRDVVGADVEGGDGEARIVVLHEGEEAAGAAGDVDQAAVGDAALAEELVDRHQRLPAHGVGGAAEEDLHLVVVEPRRFLAQIAVGLVMEGAPVVVGEALGLVGRDLRAFLAAAPAVDVRQVGEIGEALAEGRHRAVDEIMRQAIVAGVDVPQVALDELRPVGRELAGRWHRRLQMRRHRVRDR